MQTLPLPSTPEPGSRLAAYAAEELADADAERVARLLREHGFLAYGEDGRGRWAFHPSRCAIPLRFFECWGEDWNELPLCSHFFAPDLQVAVRIACAEFGHITRLVEVTAPAAAPERAEPELPLEVAA
jgi:hypothetical protein